MKSMVKILATLFGVTIISFMLIHFSNIDPAEAYARRNFINPTEEQIVKIRHDLGYDEPLIKQYKDYIKCVLKGDLGISLVTANPVSEDIIMKMKPTMILVFATSIWIILLTMVFGILSAIYRNSILDHLIRLFTMIGISIPSFWLGYILLLWLAVKLSVFKVVDYGTIKSLILPSFTFAIPVSSSLIRMLRSDLISEFSKDYYIYAKARGIRGKNLMCYSLRNALPPIITMFFQNLGFLIGGSAIIESLFSWPGFGEYFVKVILERDLPAMSGCILVIATIFLFFNWLSDAINMKLNLIMARRQ